MGRTHFPPETTPKPQKKRPTYVQQVCLITIGLEREGEVTAGFGDCGPVLMVIWHG